ncbi:MAG: Hsp20/alpha crystallin family protein [Clostridia bacterium]|nr:Hsp20/alpha crystallin family protein [Clostridia bacterium]
MLNSMRPYTPFTPFSLFDDPFFAPVKSASLPTAFRTDVKDEGDRFLIEADLPGYKKEEVSVSVKDGVLTVSAEKKEEKEEQKEGGYLFRERHYGKMERHFDLSAIDEEGIEGRLENGVLTLTLPKKKKEEPATRTIALA